LGTTVHLPEATTYHELMLCFADGDIVGKISAVVDMLSGSMLTTHVSYAM